VVEIGPKWPKRCTMQSTFLPPFENILLLLTLIPTGVTIYGSHYFKAKFLEKLLNNTNLKKIAKFCLHSFILIPAVFFKEMRKKVWEHIYFSQEAVKNPSFSSNSKSIAISTTFVGQFVPQPPPPTPGYGTAECFALQFCSQTC
jgi:hypothetical protein